jgi:hypothetical protein
VSDVFARIAAFMREFESPPARALHCGAAVWDSLRTLTPDDTGPIGLGAALGGQPLYGVPVHIEHGMHAGKWELREGERVVASGDIAPPGHSNAPYVPGHGFIVGFTMREDE